MNRNTAAQTQLQMQTNNMLQQAISTRAFEKFAGRNWQHGNDVQDWQQAEQEIRAEIEQSGLSPLEFLTLYNSRQITTGNGEQPIQAILAVNTETDRQRQSTRQMAIPVGHGEHGK